MTGSRRGLYPVLLVACRALSLAGLGWTAVAFGLALSGEGGLGPLLGPSGVVAAGAGTAGTWLVRRHARRTAMVGMGLAAGTRASVGDPHALGADRARRALVAEVVAGLWWHPASLRVLGDLVDLAQRAVPADRLSPPVLERWVQAVLAEAGSSAAVPTRGRDARLLAAVCGLMAAGYSPAEAARVLRLPAGDPSRPGPDQVAAMRALEELRRQAG